MSRPPPLSVAFASGLLFGIGLIVSGMSRPTKVLGFLDVTRNWDPSLALVMGAALMVTLPAFTWARRRGRTLSGTPIELPDNRTIDGRLVIGSVVFGLGWGLIGLCPGPALLGLGFASLPGITFVAALIAGQRIAERLWR